MSGVWALLPLKGFDEAKQRLQSVLNATQRSQLFVAMVEDLIEQLLQVDALAGIAIVSGQLQAKTMAERMGVKFLPEPSHIKGLNQALQWGLGQLTGFGAKQALVLHGDLPVVKHTDVTALIAKATSTGACLIPDWRESGTNGLILKLPSLINVAYGIDSFARHKSLLASSGVKVMEVMQSTLAFDVDTPQDLHYLQALAKQGLVGKRCRKALAEFELEQGFVAQSADILVPELDLLKSRLGC